ncbi:hypothetical protein L7F22_002475 [Adiantum nelumboides]|nr:hypothetical protein [Adiantum nelumboides]
MMPNQTLAEVMLEPVEPETYYPFQFRKSSGKTRPMGGGRTPSAVGRWTDFEQSLHAWWSGNSRQQRQTRQQAAAAQPGSPKGVLSGKLTPERFPRQGVCGISVSKEDEVRAALVVSVFIPVNEAAGPSGLNMRFKLNSTESIQCARSNVDWAGFIVSTSVSAVIDIFQHLCLPIEIKPPWQFQTPPEAHVVDLLLSSNEAERDMVRFVVAQLYLYMILEEAEYGVLCSKEQYVFFKRVGDPARKVLLCSKTFMCSDPIGIRRCFLFTCHLAQTSSTISVAAVDQAGPTPLMRKLVTPRGQTRLHSQVSLPLRVPTRRASPLLEETLPSGIFYLEEYVPDVYFTPNMLSAQSSYPASLWIRDVDIHAQDLGLWFRGLAEFDLFSLELGNVLSSHGRVIVREAYIWGKPAVLKMYELIEDAEETLVGFFREVSAYTELQDLQGIAVPEVLAYGSVWGNYMGFLALSREGHALCPYGMSERRSPEFVRLAMSSLQSIHLEGVLHGDLSLGNIIMSGQRVMFIDFERSSLQARHEYLEVEMKNLQALLEGELCDGTCVDS